MNVFVCLNVLAQWPQSLSFFQSYCEVVKHYMNKKSQYTSLIYIFLPIREKQYIHFLLSYLFLTEYTSKHLEQILNEWRDLFMKLKVFLWIQFSSQ